MKKEWINLHTGEIYRNLGHALVTIVHDMIHFPLCRTWKMFCITVFDENKDYKPIL